MNGALDEILVGCSADELDVNLDFLGRTTEAVRRESARLTDVATPVAGRGGRGVTVGE